MTVITKPFGETKKDTLKKPLVAAGEVRDGETKVEMTGAGDEPVFFTNGRGQRASATTILCVFMASLIVLGIGVVGGLYIYRYYGRVNSHKVKGWFQIPANRLPESSQYLQNTEDLHEEFEMDLEENYANIYVPDFGLGRRGRFIHDFSTNKTGIVDVDGDRCFVMPLNRERIIPPRSMYDLFTKMWGGEYDVDTEVIRETYRVAFPPITSFEDMGKFIYRDCNRFPTYRLVKVSDGINKRSISESQIYAEFGGKKITRFEINMDGLQEYEKDHVSH